MAGSCSEFRNLKRFWFRSVDALASLSARSAKNKFHGNRLEQDEDGPKRLLVGPNCACNV